MSREVIVESLNVYSKNNAESVILEEICCI